MTQLTSAHRPNRLEVEMHKGQGKESQDRIGCSQIQYAWKAVAQLDAEVPLVPAQRMYALPLYREGGREGDWEGQDAKLGPLLYSLPERAKSSMCNSHPVPFIVRGVVLPSHACFCHVVLCRGWCRSVSAHQLCSVDHSRLHGGLAHPQKGGDAPLHSPLFRRLYPLQPFAYQDSDSSGSSSS